MSSFEKQITWKKWAEQIQALGLQDFAAVLLEATGPVNSIGAQMVYFSQPILNSLFKNNDLDALAELLEEPNHTQEFIRYLKDT